MLADQAFANALDTVDVKGANAQRRRRDDVVVYIVKEHGAVWRYAEPIKCCQVNPGIRLSEPHLMRGDCDLEEVGDAEIARIPLPVQFIRIAQSRQAKS